MPRVSHTCLMIDLYITLFQLVKTPESVPSGWSKWRVREAQKKLVKTEKISLFKTKTRLALGLAGLRGLDSIIMTHCLHFWMLHLCVAFIQVGSFHKAERWPSALSLHSLFSAAPMEKRSLSPSLNNSKEPRRNLAGLSFVNSHCSTNSWDWGEGMYWLHSPEPRAYLWSCAYGPQSHPNHMDQWWWGLLLPAEGNAFKAQITDIQSTL